MARLARFVFPGYPHHVVQRGNCDQPVFVEDADFRHYLEWLREYSTRYGVDIWAYCLMPTHVHFICVPKAKDALARAFNTLHMRYAQYFNGKRTVHGHLWRARFMSCVLDDPSVREEVRFIENNPVRARLVTHAEDYPWSSARSHVLKDQDPLLSEGCFLTEEIPDWHEYLGDLGEGTIVERVRERLKTGRPSGNWEFVQTLELIVGHRLTPCPRGRPRKITSKRGPFL